MEQAVRYCTTDDRVRIAYSTRGEGTPLLVCPFFVEGFTVADESPEYTEFVTGLGRGRQLVRYDMRGTGLSQRDVSDFTLQAVMLDIDAVVREVGVDQIVLYGQGMSGPRTVAYAASHPERVSQLVLYSTYANPDKVMPDGAVHAFAELARYNWAIASQALVDLSGRENAGDLNVRGAKMLRDSAEGSAVGQILDDTVATYNVTHLLAGVRAPTLIVQSTTTQLFRAELARELASGIPNAQLRMFTGNANWLGTGIGTFVAQAVDEFLGVVPAESATKAANAFRTVLFTDLVGHTEMMQQLGDAKGRDVLREHERITRETLKQYAGAEVKTMGDGFLASFSSVTSAMDCAVALQEAFAAWNARPQHAASLQVRVGLNAGEPIEEDGDLFGATVIVASRMAALANAGEILIPEGVRHLLAGKGFTFTDRGETTLKGFDDAVRLYEVRWRD